MPEDSTPPVLARINSSELSQVVPRLEPEDLHAVIVHRGLHDCGELLALVTPEQLSAVLDLDLWKAPGAGEEEQFDAARFCEWLEAFVDTGPAIAAARLAAIDANLVVAGLSPNITVFDAAVFSPAGETSGAAAVLNEGRERGLHVEIGGYLVVARKGDAWDSIVQLLITLDEQHHETFRRVMQSCCTLSNSGFELDGLNQLFSDREQARFDLSASRDERRERLGYVAPLEARAFLDAARRTPAPQPSHEQRPASGASLALVPGSRGESASVEPVLFLANVLVSGCSVQGRSFALHEALDAVSATCTLGREYGSLDLSPEEHHDPVASFRVGWSVLHREVTLTAAARLLDALGSMQCRDPDLQVELYALRRELDRRRRAGTPWHARGRMEVLAQLDLPTWAALSALFDECPVMLANVNPPGGHQPNTVHPSEFQFVANREHIAAVHRFLRSLPELLTR